jgi:galactoside O-acetyltransferase
MTEKERMEAGLLYDPVVDELQVVQAELNERLKEFNDLKPSQYEEQQRYMKEVFAECGDNVYLQRPLNANFGGSHVHFGSNIYANFNLTLVDDGHIYIGDWAKFGPNVTIVTAGHPVPPELRRNPTLQFNRDVHIEEGVWLGAGVIVLPGVTIGRNSVIGAGSVVTKDIPANVVAVGNPCRVLREIGEHDREFYFRDKRIDFSKLDR